MRKIYLQIIFIWVLMSPCAFASQTTPLFLMAPLFSGCAVTTNGGNISATINPDTGALSTSFTPAFKLTTLSGSAKALTYSATCNTTTTAQNAIFNISTKKYIILTNSTVLPPVSSVNNIKTGAPTAASNPNAMAYIINDPPAIAGQLAVSYNTTNKLWNLTLTHLGNTNTSITVPAATPLGNTYSFDDEPGAYQATITLSFI